MTKQVLDIIQLFMLTGISFIVALIWTPFLTYFLYKYKLWKKKPQTEKWLKKVNVKNQQKEISTPRMGGLLVWVTVLVLCFVFSLWRSVWLPLFVLVVSSIIGLVDDFWAVGKTREGLSFKGRALTVLVLGFLTGYLFYAHLGWPSYFISLVPIVMLIIFGGAPIDGLDGLAGGVMVMIFSAYSVICFAQGQIDLALFCGLIVGSLLAFLYFNVPPARFYLGETSMLGLLTCLVVIWVLPIIAFPLIATALSDLLQIFSYQIFKRRIFKITPLHHHFQALGWPHYKVTMRYWIFSAGFAIIGLVVALLCCC